MQTVLPSLRGALGLVITVSAAALAGCFNSGSCPQPNAAEELCFDWPLPADGGAGGGDPGACPAPTSEEAEIDLTQYGKDDKGEGVQQGVNVIGAGSTKAGACCYQAQQIFFCE